MHPATHARTPPTRRIAATVAIALALTLAATGCGSDDDTTAANNNTQPASGASDQDQIKATYSQLDQSIRNKDYQQACQLMTDAMQDQTATANQDCPTGFETLLASNKPSPNPLKLSNIKIKGNKAKASAQSKDTLAAIPVEFTKQNNTWLLSGPLIK